MPGVESLLRRARYGAACALVSVIAVSVLVGCAPQFGGTEALADEVIAVSEEFAGILEASAHPETSTLDDRMFTTLGRDYRQLGTVGSMVAVPRGLLASSIDERQARVVMVLATTEHTEDGLTYEHSNAFTCLELTGTFHENPQVERRNIDCNRAVVETYLGTNHYSIDELNYR